MNTNTILLIAETVSEDPSCHLQLLREMAARSALSGVQAGLAPAYAVADWFEENQGTVKDLGEILCDLREYIISKVAKVQTIANREDGKVRQREFSSDNSPWAKLIIHIYWLVNKHNDFGAIPIFLVKHYKPGDASIDELVGRMADYLKGHLKLAEKEMMATSHPPILKGFGIVIDAYKEAIDYISILQERVVPLLSR